MAGPLITRREQLTGDQRIEGETHTSQKTDILSFPTRADVFAIIARSRLFDSPFFRRLYPQISGSDDELLEYYLDFGAQLGLQPNPCFEPAWYLQQYPDVEASGMHALVHYILHGDVENRFPGPFFDTGWYRHRHTLSCDQLALAHYLTERCKGFVSPHPAFDIDFYALSNPEVTIEGVDLFEHFISRGFREGRNPSATFDINWYANEHLSGSLAENPFRHWLLHRSLQTAEFRPQILGFEPILVTLEEAKITPRGILLVRGWATGYARIESIEVLLGKRVLGSPERGLSRPDIAEAYPDFFNAAESGFFLQAEIGDDLLAIGEVTVRVKMTGGVTRSANRTLILPNAIRRRYPASKEVLYHYEKTLLSADGDVYIEGWATCADVIKEIEVSLDRAVIGLARLGLPRPDVGNIYPSIPSARNSGFCFSAKLEDGEWDGEHVFTLEMLTLAGTSYQAILPVLVANGFTTKDGTNSASEANDTIRLSIDQPQITEGIAVEKVTGALTVSGWALARAGVAKVAVYLGEAVVGNAYYGLRRQDILAAFPDWGDSGLLSGYAITLPKRTFTANRHTIRIVVTDKLGDFRDTAFSIDVEFAEDGTESSGLRTRMPQSEIDLKLRLVESAPYRPAFMVGLLIGGTSPEELMRAHYTLKSLRDQSFVEFSIQLLGRQALTGELTEMANQ